MSRRNKSFRWHRVKGIQYALYLLVRVVAMIFDMFPLRTSMKIHGFTGRIIRLIDRKHVKITRKNLERSPTAVAPDDIEAFTQRAYAHLGRSFVEILSVPGLLRRRKFMSLMRMERFELLEPLFRKGRGIIVTIGHLGNWEIIGLAVSLSGYPLHSLARPIENPWIERWLKRFRSRTGQIIISKYNALGEMVRVLKRNEILVIQVDQDARDSGVFVEFFGRPASTHRSPALLALKYGSPILPVNIYRDRDKNVCLVTEPIFPEDFKKCADPVQELTQAFTTRLEQFVLEHPEQWLWMHDRWKTAERVQRAKDAEAAAATTRA